jgi:hypothetical protein
MHKVLKFKASDGLIGMWGHTFDDDGDIDLQFQIVRRSGDMYLIELYSWTDGNPSGCIAVSRARILDLKLYESCEAMNAAYEKHVQQQQWKQQGVADLVAYRAGR